MKLAIIGSSNFTNYDLLKNTLDETYTNIETIISGGSIGADTLAEKYADEKGIDKLIYLPNWKLYGIKAEYIRNRLIVLKCDEMIAFWDGSSKGTREKLDYANELGKKVKIIQY